jgi:hypothetical protein
VYFAPGFMLGCCGGQEPCSTWGRHPQVNTPQLGQQSSSLQFSMQHTACSEADMQEPLQRVHQQLLVVHTDLTSQHQQHGLCSACEMAPFNRAAACLLLSALPVAGAATVAAFACIMRLIQE